MFASSSSPSAPTSVKALATVGDIRVSWSPPLSDGGAVIDRYKLELSSNGIHWKVICADASNPYSLTDVAVGSSVDIRISAHNVHGWGVASVPINVAALAAPGAPTSFSETHTADTACISWSGVPNGGLTHISYSLLYRELGRIDWISINPVVSPVNLQGLEPATTYEVQVRATNAVGVGPIASHVFTTDLVDAAEQSRFRYPSV